MQMTLPEFMRIHCQDIVAMKQADLTNPFASFRYDEIVDTNVPVIFDSSGREIPVEEIVQLPFKDFCALYPGQSSAEAFRNYVSAYTIIQGEDLLQEYANKMAQSREKLASYRTIEKSADLIDI